MGSIGDTFTPAVPSVGASGTGYATSVNAVLAELITRVSSPVPLSALLGSTLDLNNVPAIDFQYLGLYEQLAVPGASPVGRLERFENNLYWVGLSGAVQITDGANLAAAGIGGIGGDYGGINPALVSFVDAANRYDFYDDAAGLVWAHLRARSIYLSGTATGANFAQITFGGGSTYTLTLPSSLPAAGNSVVTISNTGALAANKAADPITTDIVLSGATKVQHGDRTVQFMPGTFAVGSGVFVYSTGSLQGTTAGIVRIDLNGFQQGWRLKSVKVRLNKLAAGATAVSLLRVVDAGTTAIATGNSTTVGFHNHTITAGTPYVIVTGDAFCLQVTTATNNDGILNIEVTYDVPA